MAKQCNNEQGTLDPEGQPTVDRRPDLPPALEDLISLSEAAKRLPNRRGGRPTHPSTIHRWAQGTKGTRLKTLKVGGALCTTEAWLMDFFRAITDVPQTSAEDDS